MIEYSVVWSTQMSNFSKSNNILLKYHFSLSLSKSLKSIWCEFNLSINFTYIVQKRTNTSIIHIYMYAYTAYYGSIKFWPGKLLDESSFCDDWNQYYFLILESKNTVI